ncbi:methylmalonyl-CoA mutase OS=Streptomyces microflavus OX=1919 GN=Smic_00290 PE=4 SV=1 [Streptomyces microflavus]
MHAVTSPVMMTRRDPWVNMLRTTLATLGAGVGGADSVTVLPFDHALGLPDAFARRIARNTSTILMEESQSGPGHRPGGRLLVRGAAHRRTRGGRLGVLPGDRAGGGPPAALRSGMVAERLAATWAARSAKLARRKEPITGVSEFPMPSERPVEREPSPDPYAGAPGGLPRVRRDEAFEALRARSDAHLAATGERPKVFIAALGLAAAHTARVSFAVNLFGAGGIEAVHQPVSVDTSMPARP